VKDTEKGKSQTFYQEEGKSAQDARELDQNRRTDEKESHKKKVPYWRRATAQSPTLERIMIFFSRRGALRRF